MLLRAFSAGNVGERGRSRYVVLNNYDFFVYFVCFVVNNYKQYSFLS
ncbi:hypothetical protein U14_03265 [Candidatus Moduliflexus flocculans]|uniref:Uncharacterized protein n=1 Tax=Candidatus Moduliflexus flocculans TaxID=1499966 RepID=A0A081BNQ2_9BACT|nr:hypothetical protein U14_03265 [Candidatus Moduliflexus flocculans]